MGKSSFAVMSNGGNKFSRKWGSIKNAVDPYITGYHFINFAYLPPKLEDAVKHAGGNSLSSLTNTNIKNILASACLSVNIPGATVSKAEFNGLGNVRWAVPSGVDWDNNCSMRFLETSGLPIHGIMHGWVRMIRDYRSGVSLLDEGDDSQGYTRANYGATMFYWTTQPNGKYVEYHSCMTGLFPMKDPTDQFGHDLSSYDKMEIDIDFNVDYIWHEQWTYNKCKSYAEDYFGVWGGKAGGTVNSYGEEDSQ